MMKNKKKDDNSFDKGEGEKAVKRQPGNGENLLKKPAKKSRDD